MVLENGAALYDSVVICEFLAARQGDRNLFPATGNERWTVLRQHALADGIMEADVAWLNEKRRDPSLHFQRIMAGYRSKIAAGLTALEEDVEFLAKGKLTIAQIAAFCALAHLDFRFPDEPWRPNRPRLTGWFEVFAERPSAKATVFVDQY
jgi:glutathione S-transferase